MKGLKTNSIKRNLSVIFALVFFFSLIPIKGFIAAANESPQGIEVLAPVINEDGTVTFKVKYEGDSLYLVGGMTNWDAGQISMTKGDDGYFTCTTGVLTPDTYEYKFKPNADNWNGNFNAEGVLDGGNSKLVIKPLGATLNEDGTVTFRVKNDSETLYLVGDMTNWGSDPVEMTKGTDGVFEVTLTLTPGTHQYKYKPSADPANWDGNINQDGVVDGANSEVFVPNSNVELASPVDNGDGTVTFNAKYTGDTLYLIGEMCNWSVADQIPMVKDTETGVFSVTIPLEEGRYEYKFKPNADNWNNSFRDPLNSEVAGDNSVVYVGSVQKDEKKYIEFTYVRDDKDYADWNIWTWSTGAADGQKDFVVDEERGVAVSKFEISANATAVGFKVRKGDGWDTVDYNSDRSIKIDPSLDVIKVTVTSGVAEIFQVPAIENAVIDNGVIKFKYRNKELYNESAQDKIQKVQLKLVKPGESEAILLNMPYDEKNEYFYNDFEDLKDGTYKYSFLVTIDGETTETEVQEISYRKLEMGGSASISPSAVNYNENAVLSLNIEGQDGSADSIREIYIDLTSVGGPSKVNMSKELIKDGQVSQTIAVSDKATAGEKEIPVVIVDNNGEEHRVSANLTVKSDINANDFGFDEARIYFAVTDRFNNGDESNDDPNGNNYDKENPFTYHGGDFKGLSEKIDYLKELGVNTIWITPIVENTDFNQQFAGGGTQYSYHGYWAKDFTKLDPHLGSMEDFKELLDTAHDNGIKIMVDVVLNHAGYGMKSENEGGNGAANNYPTNLDRDAFAGMLREVGGADELTQESSGLPDFKTEDPEVRAKLIKWQTSWIENAKTEKGNTIDYFRIDTVKHVDEASWKEFKNKLTEIDPEFKIIGEYYGADVNQDGGKLQSGQMDALLDFGYKSLAESFVNGNIEEVTESLNERADKINNNYLLGQFLGSHDEDSFLERVDGDLGKLMAASALQITDKGIPVVYYGEELGMSGLNGMENGDANRYDMDFNLLDTEEGSLVYNHYKKLLNTRDKYSLIFAKGDRTTIGGSNEEGYTAFARTYKGQSVVTLINVKDEPKEAEITVPFEAGTVLVDSYNDKEYTVSKDGTVKVELLAMSEGGTAILADKNAEEVNPGVDSEEDNNEPTNNGGTTNNGSSSNSNGNGTKTGDTNNGIVVFAIIMVVSGCAVVLFKRKKA